MSRRLTDYVQHTDLKLPHHQAFWELVQAQLPAGFLDDGGEGRSVWTAAPKPAQALNLQPAYDLIREYEGCHLDAYLCPAKVWTIGWGVTRINGRPVQKGDRITHAQADEMLRHTVEQQIVPALAKIPHWSSMSPGQHGALISFAFNLGWNFYGAKGFETITARLRDKDWAKVPDALLLYRNPGSSFEAGLRRRREAEGRLWLEGLGLPQVQQQPGRVRPGDPFSSMLTPHIRLGEFALDQEARRFHHQHQVETAAELAAFMERARVAFGGRPVIITSGYRPPAINRSVGGASGSEHLFNEPGVGAVDFFIRGADIQAVERWIDKKWPFSLGYGAAKGFHHVGIRQGRPRVRWDY
jgi:GH24 family phage-related lysozyme (muramidase)